MCPGNEAVTLHYTCLTQTPLTSSLAQISYAINPRVNLLSLQRPSAVHCDLGGANFSVPPELSGPEESGMRYLNWSYQAENYQLVPSVLQN